MERNYAKVSYHNCGMDYDYTICQWHDLQDNLNIAETVFLDADPKDFKEHGKPSITIEPILMTDKQFEEWFIKNVESEA